MDLARRGIITVEDTPKGLMMVYKPRDAEEALRDAKNAQKERAAEAEADREERMLAEAIERARKKARLDGGGDAGDTAAAGDAQGGAPPQELVRRDDGGAGVKLSLAAARGGAARPRLAVEEEDGSGTAAAAPAAGHAHPSAVASLIADDLAAKDAADRRTKDWWLATGIVVKIMARELASHGLYKSKGTVTALVDKYTAEVTVMAGEPVGGPAPAVVRVDQAHLETVLPRPGGLVRILRGGARGCDGRLVGVDEARFKAKVRVVQPRGPLDGKELELDYEDVSKLAVQQ
jgi:DNA/RNA-binding protein KIN17